MAKNKAGGPDLNMAIASMHALNNRLIGLQMTSGNVIGIVLSAIQVTFGALIVSHPVWYVGVFLAPVTCALAVVIERLSLGGLGIVRNSIEKLAQLADTEFEVQSGEDGRPLTDLEKRNFKRRRSALWWTLAGCLVVVLLGIAISAFVGDMFWRWVWAGAGEPLTGVLSVCCAGVISLGFVFSELFKHASDDEVEERVKDNRIGRAVLKNADSNLKLNIGLEAFGNVQKDQEKKAKALTKIENVVGKSLETYADQVTSIGDAEEINGAERKMLPERAASKRSKFEENREELIILLQTRPGVSRQEIADRFGVSKSTAQSWVSKVTTVEEV